MRLKLRWLGVSCVIAVLVNATVASAYFDGNGNWFLDPDDEWRYAQVLEQVELTGSLGAGGTTVIGVGLWGGTGNGAAVGVGAAGGTVTPGTVDKIIQFVEKIANFANQNLKLANNGDLVWLHPQEF